MMTQAPDSSLQAVHSSLDSVVLTPDSGARATRSHLEPFPLTISAQVILLDATEIIMVRVENNRAERELQKKITPLSQYIHTRVALIHFCKTFYY